MTVIVGLIIAVLADRVRYESVVKAMVFVPLAISFVAAGVIWNFQYDFSPARGTVNAGLGLIGIEPQSWMTEWPRNTFMLILVGIWMWVGFATVILSAGLKGISTELLEAARMDGATELQVFFRIILPLLAPTVAVVGTTIVITALKTFDIVYVMTNGQYDTEVIGTALYHARFTNHDAGHGGRHRHHPAAHHHPGDADQHSPLPGAGGHPMTDRQTRPRDRDGRYRRRRPATRGACCPVAGAAGSAARSCTPS